MDLCQQDPLRGAGQPSPNTDGQFRASANTISGYSLYDATDSSQALPERTRYAGVGPRSLAVLGLAPALGRGLDERVHRFGTPTTLLVSDRFWRDRLGADPAAQWCGVCGGAPCEILSAAYRHAKFCSTQLRRSFWPPGGPT